MSKKIYSIHNTWFFTHAPWYMRFLLIYINGDMIVLLPFILFILILGFFWLKGAVLFAGLYIGFRHLGEMTYWFLQQFSSRKFRPYDFGLRQLDNHAIYIVYQTLSLVCTIFGFAIVLATLFMIK